MKQVWTKDQIKELLLSNPNAVMRGILAIYRLQTESEKMGQHTNEVNGVGFNKFDVKFLTSLAQRMERGLPLTEKQLIAGRKAILKYSGQLAKIANGEIHIQ